jgi:hypothetical protein
MGAGSRRTKLKLPLDKYAKGVYWGPAEITRRNWEIIAIRGMDSGSEQLAIRLPTAEKENAFSFDRLSDLLERDR